MLKSQLRFSDILNITQTRKTKNVFHTKNLSTKITRRDQSVRSRIQSTNTMDNLYWNLCFDKSRIKTFISWYLLNNGEFKTVALLDQLKRLGFESATKAGISLGIDDLKIPPKKKKLLYEAESETSVANQKYKRGDILGVEKFQRLISSWHRVSETLKTEVVRHFEETNTLNPVYMMAFSGARGNISQVRQLVGMRGLMSDPQGRIIDFPILRNFREGLTLTEYLISCFGARKGIVDTALRTANAGYLTRRLVDVAHHVIIAQLDCGTTDGIGITPMKEGTKYIYTLQNRLVGRIVAETILHDGKVICSKNDELTQDLALKISSLKTKVLIRSPLTCDSKNLVCQLCYGWSLADGRLVSIGETVGIIAAQSIGEPGTQLTMRTFHTGGVFTSDVSDQIKAPYTGIVDFDGPIPGSLVRTAEGTIGFLTKTEGGFSIRQSSHIGLKGSETTQRTKYKIPALTLLFIRHQQKVIAKELIAQITSINQQTAQRDNSEQTLLSELEGEIVFANIRYRQSPESPKKEVWTTQKQELKISECRAAAESSINQIGSIWLLSGKIYQFPIKTKTFTRTGDYITKRTPLNEIIWYKAGSSLTIQNPLEIFIPNNFKHVGKTNLNVQHTARAEYSPDGHNPMSHMLKHSQRPLRSEAQILDSFLFRKRFLINKITYKNFGYLVKLNHKKTESFSSWNPTLFLTTAFSNDLKTLEKIGDAHLAMQNLSSLNLSPGGKKTVYEGFLKNKKEASMHAFLHMYDRNKQTQTGGLLAFENVARFGDLLFIQRKLAPSSFTDTAAARTQLQLPKSWPDYVNILPQNKKLENWVKKAIFVKNILNKKQNIWKFTALKGIHSKCPVGSQKDSPPLGLCPKDGKGRFRRKGSKRSASVQTNEAFSDDFYYIAQAFYTFSGLLKQEVNLSLTSRNLQTPAAMPSESFVRRLPKGPIRVPQKLTVFKLSDIQENRINLNVQKDIKSSSGTIRHAARATTSKTDLVCRTKWNALDIPTLIKRNRQGLKTSLLQEKYWLSPDSIAMGAIPKVPPHIVGMSLSSNNGGLVIIKQKHIHNQKKVISRQSNLLKIVVGGESKTTLNIKHSCQAYNIQVKRGVVYFPRDITTAFTKHKSFSFPGQLFMDDILFSTVLYSECFKLTPESPYRGESLRDPYGHKKASPEKSRESGKSDGSHHKRVYPRGRYSDTPQQGHISFAKIIKTNSNCRFKPSFIPCLPFAIADSSTTINRKVLSSGLVNKAQLRISRDILCKESQYLANFFLLIRNSKTIKQRNTIDQQRFLSEYYSTCSLHNITSISNQRTLNFTIYHNRQRRKSYKKKSLNTSPAIYLLARVLGPAGTQRRSVAENSRKNLAAEPIKREHGVSGLNHSTYQIENTFHKMIHQKLQPIRSLLINGDTLFASWHFFSSIQKNVLNSFFEKKKVGKTKNFLLELVPFFRHTLWEKDFNLSPGGHRQGLYESKSWVGVSRESSHGTQSLKIIRPEILNPLLTKNLFIVFRKSLNFAPLNILTTLSSEITMLSESVPIRLSSNSSSYQLPGIFAFSIPYPIKPNSYLIKNRANMASHIADRVSDSKSRILLRTQNSTISNVDYPIALAKTNFISPFEGEVITEKQRTTKVEFLILTKNDLYSYRNRETPQPSTA